MLDTIEQPAFIVAMLFDLSLSQIRITLIAIRLCIHQYPFAIHLAMSGFLMIRVMLGNPPTQIMCLTDIHLLRSGMLKHIH